MPLTPMLQQYQSIRKTLTRDTILFFRLGDFYEMFFEDATTASAILDITLTGRDGGLESRIPMCGVPYHSAQGYINRLTREGGQITHKGLPKTSPREIGPQSRLSVLCRELSPRTKISPGPSWSRSAIPCSPRGK